MKTRFETLEDLPGQRQVTWRRSGGWIALAAVLGIAVLATRGGPALGAARR